MCLNNRQARVTSPWRVSTALSTTAKQALKTLSPHVHSVDGAQAKLTHNRWYGRSDKSLLDFNIRTDAGSSA